MDQKFRVLRSPLPLPLPLWMVDGWVEGCTEYGGRVVSEYRALLFHVYREETHLWKHATSSEGIIHHRIQ